jgi:hypothetical protein
MSVCLFNEGCALEALRDTEFAAHSPYAEVIDNSVEAKATKIRIRFSTAAGGNGRGAAIRAVAFGDDGIGMDGATLHHCLQLGWSSRYNNRDGIGRFGVGLTMSAIHECRRVEVWSRVDGADGWLKVVMDLDEVQSGSVLIGEPEPATLPAEFADLLASREHGTLVLWSKYDRWSGSQRDLERTLEEFRVYCGRTYRDFIWAHPGVTIQINGEVVHAIDPLYARTDKTRFPGDPKAEVYPDILVPWPRDDGNGMDNIVIRLSILPEGFRRRPGEGGSSEARERYIDRNEGISILRNGREVFYGEPPLWGTGTHKWRCEDVDRWWGCEVRFPGSIDGAFRGSKRIGAVPTALLLPLLQEHITPFRNSFLASIRETWAQSEVKHRRARTSPTST